MKNFDIEKLERKNIYKTPENFFEKVQENVLKETVYKEHKVIPLETAQTTSKRNFNWVYAAAAAIAILIAGSFLFNWNQEDQLNQNIIAKVIDSAKSKTIMASNENTSNENIATEVDEPIKTTNEKNNVNLVVEKTPTSNKTNKVSFASNTTAAKKVDKKMELEERMDFILETFSDEDVAILAQNTEDDIYFDLYQ